jgi:hypothetical protein
MGVGDAPAAQGRALIRNRLTAEDNAVRYGCTAFACRAPYSESFSRFQISR